MSVNYKKILLALFLTSGLINFTCVFASSDPVTTGDLAATLSDFIDQDKKEITKIIKSNKRLLKNIKGLNPKAKTEVTKAVNELGNSIENGLTSDTIEKNLDGSLNGIGQ